ncbi:aminodeoxychorismate synthase component I [Burkholderia sp. 22PA0099]|uniref:aminodeoxychorismate synthase component I n=1 Tax=Burkholderia sp. 22PA0099 TaxID=3237372 RepID=UPI0039C1E0B9
MTHDEAGAPFALLDDCDSTASARSSRLYTGYVHERTCTDPAQLDAVCAAVAADLDGGLHALVLGDYAFGRNLQRGVAGSAPLRFLLFAGLQRLSRDEADAWLAAHDEHAGHAGQDAAEPSAAGVARLQKSVTREAFDVSIDAIHAALRAGDSYQVNYTYRLGFDAYGSPLALYRRLRARQAVRYGALIALPDARWIVSCSPELFVEKTGVRLRTRPMKGTAPRSADAAADARAASFLANDAKNRAENLMIVDLLRNDVSRVAVTGSVRVPALFTVEPYASVWQMTSTVEAEARPDAGFADMLRALFPCGSITGAPKHATMALIDAIESTPRGLYTGALGWLDAAPAGSACGDFCLSVTIRTLSLDAPRADGYRPGMMGVGAGIVLDSAAADEYAECELKAKFLTDADPGFQLFETMQATRAGGVRHLDRHLARLGASAEALGFAFDATAVQARIAAHVGGIEGDDAYRLRAALSKDGTLALTGAALAPLASPTVAVLLAAEHGFAPIHASDLLLAHKTTRRAEYDRAWREAEAAGAFDMLFVNERGELTEGGRSNVFVRLDGRWFTPPLASGLLPGVMRAALLDDAGFGASERVLTPDDLARADGLLICNALRGAVEATLRRI